VTKTRWSPAYPGNVPARSVETCDEPAADWISGQARQCNRSAALRSTKMLWQKPMPGTGNVWRLGEQGYSMASLPLRRPLMGELSTYGPAKSLGSTLNVLNRPCGGQTTGVASAA